MLTVLANILGTIMCWVLVAVGIGGVLLLLVALIGVAL